MGAHNHSDLVLLEELIDDIGTVAHNVILFLWVANGVDLHAEDFIIGSRVTPKDIHAHLLDCIRDVAKVDAQGPLNLIDIFEAHD